jgi:cytochrome c-type biogenesis protein CcmE
LERFVSVDDPGAGHGFDEGGGELDLRPRTGAEALPRARARRRRPVAAYLALAAVVLGIGFVVVQGLGNATLYFRNVDEAVAQRDELGTRRFRLQGLVGDDVAQAGGAVTFTLSFNGVDLPVHHAGDPLELFGPGQSVVLEGHFVEGSDVFASDYMLVKHDEDYTDDNADRIADATDGDTDGESG